MKSLFIIAIFLQFHAFGQENPWENKNTPNPWGTETTKTETPDSLAQVEIIDTAFRIANKYYLAQLKQAAKDNYKTKGDFAFGFTSGLFLNIVGVFPSIIYVVPTTKKEKNAIKKTKQDPAYSEIKPEIVEKKSANSIKSKKLMKTILGTLAGAGTQIALAIGLVIAF